MKNEKKKEIIIRMIKESGCEGGVLEYFDLCDSVEQCVIVNPAFNENKLPDLVENEIHKYCDALGIICCILSDNIDKYSKKQIHSAVCGLVELISNYENDDIMHKAVEKAIKIIDYVSVYAKGYEIERFLNKFIPESCWFDNRIVRYSLIAFHILNGDFNEKDFYDICAFND